MESPGLPKWAPWAILFAVLALGGVVAYKARGLRNNNPGNLRYTGIAWKGLIGQDKDGFCIFDTPLNGLRAMARNLLNYQAKHQLYTITGIISRWAPSFENDTTAYINMVSKAVKVGPTETFDVVNNDANMVALVKAITKHENGLNPYSDALVLQAVKAAA